jgi:hypothetical protein
MPPIPEKISKTKIIVYKSRVDPTIVKLSAEKMKYKLFAKSNFAKKAEEIRVVSVDKYYEPYSLIDAEYSVEYFKKKIYTLDIDSETEKVIISGTKYDPKIDNNNSEDSRSVITLEAELWSSYKDKAYLAFDKEGNEISPNQVPSAPSEDHPEKILEEFTKNTENVESYPQKGIELIKSKVIKRPPKVDTIEKELFQISEHAMIYSPIYEITFRNVRTGEEKIVKIDGVTAKTIV